MVAQRRFTVHLLPEPEGGFTVRVPALPEVVTCGDTYEEAMASAREAIEAILEL
jgi:antitoxin HicB